MTGQVLIKLELLDGKPIIANLAHVVTISEERGGSKLVFASGTSITVKEKTVEFEAMLGSIA